MNRLPMIKVLSASSSESESENSESLGEDLLDEQITEIEGIQKLNKDLKNRITYQIMQFRNSSRQTFKKIETSEALDKVENNESKFKSIGVIKGLIKEFRSSKADLQSIIKNVQKVESESDSLYDKLKDLEDKVREKNLRRNGVSCNCNCIGF